MAPVASAQEQASEHSLLPRAQGSDEDPRVELISELKASFRPWNRDRFTHWEQAMSAMYVALPKNQKGHLDHAQARYLLHRAFVAQRGWNIAGLEPIADAGNASSLSNSLKQWAPSYLLDTIEELLGFEGINLNELVVVAATFEDLIHKEAIGRLRDVYDDMQISTGTSIGEDVADRVITTYMTMYTSVKKKLTAKNVREQDLLPEVETQRWLREVRKNVTGAPFDFAATTRVVEEVGERYASFNEYECRALKSKLVEMEDKSQPGHVRLSDFHAESHGGYWNFNEDVPYLRQLGALAESGSGEPHVIVPNYVSSDTNCLESSSFYKVCCRSECEELVGQLEAVIAAPMAEPGRIAELVAALASDTVEAPRQLSVELLEQLERIARSHDGQVPLHSRVFARWMHKAYPRECPAPQTTETPQTADEWMQLSAAEKSMTPRKLRVRLSEAEKSPETRFLRKLFNVSSRRLQMRSSTPAKSITSRRLATRMLTSPSHVSADDAATLLESESKSPTSNRLLLSTREETVDNVLVPSFIDRLMGRDMCPWPAEWSADPSMKKLRLNSALGLSASRASSQPLRRNILTPRSARSGAQDQDEISLVGKALPKSNKEVASEGSDILQSRLSLASKGTTNVQTAGKRSLLGGLSSGRSNADSVIANPDALYDDIEEMNAQRDIQEARTPRDRLVLLGDGSEGPLAVHPVTTLSGHPIAAALGSAFSKLAPLVFVSVFLSLAVAINKARNSKEGKHRDLDDGGAIDTAVIQHAAVASVRQRGSAGERAAFSGVV